MSFLLAETMLLGSRSQPLAAIDRLLEGLTSLAEPRHQFIEGKSPPRQPLFSLDPGAAASATSPASGASSAEAKAAQSRLIDALARAAKAMESVPGLPGSATNNLADASGAIDWLSRSSKRQLGARDVLDVDRHIALDQLQRAQAAGGPRPALPQPATGDAAAQWARLAAGLLAEPASDTAMSFEVRAAWQTLADELRAVLGGRLPGLSAATEVGARLGPRGPLQAPNEADRLAPLRARPPGRFEFYPLEEFGRFIQQGLSGRQRVREGREQEIRDAVKKLAERGVRVENFPPPAPATFAEGPA